MHIKINKIGEILWIMLAAFGLYFCTYAIRKPFLSGTYQGLTYLGVSYKSMLIVVQVLGYLTSKIIGIKVISEINPSKRILLILTLLGIAQLSLYFFAVVSPPYNIAFIFFNGLPLGMIYGLIFSFLEGRKITELLGISLSINLVMTSGILKSIYLYLQQTLNISEMWLPCVIAVGSLPFILLFVWMLHKIKKPTEADVKARQIRNPMTKKDRKILLASQGLGLICLALLYTFFTTIRDFRDNFSIEIWKELNTGALDYSIFAKFETLIALIVMAIIGTMIFIKENKTAFRVNSMLIFGSLLGLLIGSLQFNAQIISFNSWYLITGISLFLPYLLLQVAFFERLLALLPVKGNVGFLIYICDSTGYLGSVLIMFGKELWLKDVIGSYAKTLTTTSIFFSIIGLFLVIIQYVFFEQKLKKQSISLNLTPA